jgi:hypothetical protein
MTSWKTWHASLMQLAEHLLRKLFQADESTLGFMGFVPCICKSCGWRPSYKRKMVAAVSPPNFRFILLQWNVIYYVCVVEDMKGPEVCIMLRLEEIELFPT